MATSLSEAELEEKGSYPHPHSSHPDRTPTPLALLKWVVLAQRESGNS